MKERGKLLNNKVVTTVMSNFGLYKALDKAGIGYEKTKVGDKYVYENMVTYGHRIGGEQSGHIILKKYATTGDGILTAIMLAEEMCDRKSTLGKLAEPVNLYPQYTKNIRVKDKAATLADANVNEALKKVEELIDGNGRALLRQSGTEPVIRIMIEAESEAKCKEFAEIIAKEITNGGYSVE
jgi:phosphoglucosamine mutase